MVNTRKQDSAAKPAQLASGVAGGAGNVIAEESRDADEATESPRSNAAVVDAEENVAEDTGSHSGNKRGPPAIVTPCTKCPKLSKKLKEVREKNQNYAVAIKELEKDVEEREDKLDEAKSYIKELEKESTASERTRAKEGNQHTKAVAALHAKIASLEAGKSSVKELLKSSVKERASAERKLRSSEDKVISLKQQLDGHAAHISELKADARSFSSKERKLHDQVKKAEKIIADLKDDVASKNEVIKDLQSTKAADQRQHQLTVLQKVEDGQEKKHQGTLAEIEAKKSLVIDAEIAKGSVSAYKADLINSNREGDSS